MSISTSLLRDDIAIKLHVSLVVITGSGMSLLGLEPMRADVPKTSI